MATEYVFLTGKGSWIRPEVINEWGKWAMVLHPDTASLEIIRELQSEGVKNVIGKDDDGYFVRISRPAEYRTKGQLKGLSPPLMFDGTKPLPGGGYAPLVGQMIGNGSDVVVKMEVYTHGIPGQPGKKAKAMRWHSCRIDTLVPFQRKDFDETMGNAVEGFDKQPKQIF